MTLLDTAYTIHFFISLGTLPLLILLLPPYLLPTKLTGIPLSQCPHPPTLSLLVLSILRAALVFVDEATRTRVAGGGGDVFCMVDTGLNVFFTTAVLAHLPLIALTFYSSLATPSRPSPPAPTARRSITYLTLAYLYGLVPLIPTLSAGLPSISSGGFGEWWGFYCIERGGWFRIVRPLTLLPPCVLTLVISFLIAQTLYSCKGNPNPFIRPGARAYAQLCLLVVCAAGSIAYLAIEQITGWEPDWWPRVFEAAAGLVLFFSLLRLPIFRSYFCWIRLRRPPLPPIDLPLYDGTSTKSISQQNLIQPTLASESNDDVVLSSGPAKVQRSSSFWTPPPPSLDAEVVGGIGLFPRPRRGTEQRKGNVPTQNASTHAPYGKTLPIAQMYQYTSPTSIPTPAPAPPSSFPRNLDHVEPNLAFPTPVPPLPVATSLLPEHPLRTPLRGRANTNANPNPHLDRPESPPFVYSVAHTSMIPSPVVAQGEAPYPLGHLPVTSRDRDEFVSSRYSMYSDSDQTTRTHTGSTLLDHETSLEGTDETLVNHSYPYSHTHNLGYGFGHGQAHGLGAWKGTLKQVEEEPPSYRGSVESGSVIFAGSNAVVPPRHPRAGAGAGAGPHAIARGSESAGDEVDVHVRLPGREEMLDSPGSTGTFGRTQPATVVGGTRSRGRLRDNMI
ncbi:hypothetical protein JCM24511_04840 [Saitozyma sp. JCM 24511]|nr:hypothetical protein JCM24511_04840 [Saitozyma sp. JCM 24511]